MHNEIRSNPQRVTRRRETGDPAFRESGQGLHADRSSGVARRRWDRRPTSSRMHWSLKVGLVLVAVSILFAVYGIYTMGAGVAAVAPKAVAEIRGNAETRLPVQQKKDLTIWQAAATRDSGVVFTCVASSTGKPVPFKPDTGMQIRVGQKTYLSMGSVSLSPGEYRFTSTGSAPGSVYTVNEALTDSVAKAGMGILGGVLVLAFAGFIGTIGLILTIVGLVKGRKASPAAVATVTAQQRSRHRIPTNQ